MRCEYLDEKGDCAGLYAGFRCIGEKCRMRKEKACEFNEFDFYCRKFRRFECIGPENCGSIDDYFAFLKKRKIGQRSK
ncbi:MAG: hypothetical protein QXN93_04085 [Methanomassiliicoccales archaeon]